MNALVDPVAISIDGFEIRIDDEGRYCLNDLHKASGEEIRNRPAIWLQNQQTQNLAHELGKDGIPSIYTKQGLGTFVRKELVYAYAMWISAAFNLKVIRTFDSVSNCAAVTLPNFTDPAAAARAWAEQFEAKKIAEQQVAELAPKAEALDTIADTANTYCIRDCAKTIGIKEKELIQLLIDKKWIYRDTDKKLQPHAQYVINHVFVNRTSPVIKNQHDGQERVFLHMRVTAFGLTRITGLVNKIKKGKTAA